MTRTSSHKLGTMIAKALVKLGVLDWALSGDPETEQEFNASFVKVVGQNEDGSAITSSDPADFGVTWAQVKAKIDQLIAEAPLKALRDERNRLIALTDWWALTDMTMTPEQAAYRQALRDITESYSSLDDVVWPVKP